MFTDRLFNVSMVAVLIVVFSLTGCAPSAPSNPADRFSGLWSGT